jgi:hypothetical protein
MKNAVHLEGLRCYGTAHDGCQAACLLFWKTAWLKLGTEMGKTTERALETERLDKGSAANTASCTEADVWVSRYAEGQETVDGPRYRCQATQLPYISTYL